MVRILLADDDKATRDLVQRALTSEGHSVAASPDGGDAVEYLEAGNLVDVLVTDVQMPSMDGLTLARRARELSPGLGIVLMSGFADQLGRGSTLGPSKITTLLKPFTLDQVRAAVRKVLG